MATDYQRFISSFYRIYYLPNVGTFLVQLWSYPSLDIGVIRSSSNKPNNRAASNLFALSRRESATFSFTWSRLTFHFLSIVPSLSIVPLLRAYHRSFHLMSLNCSFPSKTVPNIDRYVLSDMVYSVYHAIWASVDVFASF